MCGIAGYLRNRPSAPDEELLFEMIGRLRHRGPDGSGAYFDERAALGHVRLSLIDLQTGAQPLANEDGTLWIVYAGEAFNYRELRDDLRARGHRFSTATDTEVVLHLYEEYGPAALHRINGQFALAVWDSRRQELFLARDRLGVRPLYYTRTAQRFLFASEIKALLADPDAPREIDPEALAQVFTFWSPLPSRTAFRQIREVPPGHHVTVSKDGVTMCRWWSIPPPCAETRWTGSFEEACDRLAALAADAVRLRLRADVPVGSCLSGGLDSSVVAALAAEASGERLRTFAVGFAHEAFDESAFQLRMARHLNSVHTSVVVTGKAIREHFAETILHCEKPLVRTAAIPMLLLSRLVRDRGCKALLTGEGADEIFGGYNIFKEAKVRAYWAKEPESSRRPLLLRRLYPYVLGGAGRGRHFVQSFFAVGPHDRDDPLLSHRIRWHSGARHLRFLSQEARASLGADPLAALHELLPPEFDSWGVFERAQWLEMTTFLCGDLLSAQAERSAMANGVELRHPFLDVRLVEFAARLPAHWKLRALREKYILKKTFARHLPPPIVERAKQPYRAPIREVFCAIPPDSLLAGLLSAEALREAGLFDPVRVERLIATFAADSPSPAAAEGRNMALTAIASAQILHHAFVRGSLRPKRIAPPERVVRRCGQTETRTPAGGAPPLTAGKCHG